MYETVPPLLAVAVYLGIAAFGALGVALNAWIWRYT